MANEEEKLKLEKRIEDLETALIAFGEFADLAEELEEDRQQLLAHAKLTEHEWGCAGGKRFEPLVKPTWERVVEKSPPGEPVTPAPPRIAAATPPIMSAPRDFRPTDQQQTAIDKIVAWSQSDGRFCVLTGPAGSGKTTVLRALQSSFGGAVWAGMTGKAASRMKEATGISAKTLHSALYRPPIEVDNVEKRRIDLKFDEIRAESGHLLVIDEASMITEKIKCDLEKSEFKKILVVGDPYQLPPVEDDYSVFSGESGPALTEVMRTAGAVVHAATVLRETDTIHVHSEKDDKSQYDFELCASADDTFLRALELWLEDRDDHVILTWKNANRMHMNRTIRERLGIHDVEGKDDRMPQRGEPILICSNVYGQELMNGDMARVDEWLNEGPVFTGTDRYGKEFVFKSRWLRVNVDFGPAYKSARQILVLLSGGDDGWFDGRSPYVGLENWKRAVERVIKQLEGDDELREKWLPERLFSKVRRKSTDDDDDNKVSLASLHGATSITYGYCLTAHKSQGSQFRRVTTYVPGDLRSKNFQKPTTLPDGRLMSFSTRWLYTAVSRAVERSTLLVSR